jgi:hypothetical protein
MEFEALMERLREKLNPRRFPDMDPRFSILVKAILQPRKHLCIDAEGVIFDEEGSFLGTRQWFTECWEDFIISSKAGLTAEEYREAQAFQKCCLRFWRAEATDKKPYKERFAKAIYIALTVTDNPKEIATLVGEIMSSKDINPQLN